MKINNHGPRTDFNTICVGDIFGFRGSHFLKTLEFKEDGYEFPMNAVSLDGCSFVHFDDDDIVESYPTATLNLI